MTKHGMRQGREVSSTAAIFLRERMAVPVLLAWVCSVGTVTATTQTLVTGWCFRLVPDSAAVQAHPEAAAWHNARVPGSSQADLLAAGAIGDPFHRNN